MILSDTPDRTAGTLRYEIQNVERQLEDARRAYEVHRGEIEKRLEEIAAVEAELEALGPEPTSRRLDEADARRQWQRNQERLMARLRHLQHGEVVDRGGAVSDSPLRWLRWKNQLEAELEELRRELSRVS